MRLALTMLMILLASCASGPSYPPIAINTEIIREPAVGQISSMRLGDSILNYARYGTYPALRIDNYHRYTFCLYTIEVLPQSAKGKFIHPEKGTMYEAEIFLNGAKNIDNKRLLSTWIYKAYKDDTTGFLIEAPIRCGYGREQAVVQKTEEIQATDVQSASFKQELIYNGRVGNNLKIIYREYSNNMVRGAFSQEAQYDLSVSDIIAFKGARLRIVKATNEALEYEVLSHFEPITFD